MTDTQIDEMSGTWSHPIYEPVLEPEANLIPLTALPETTPGQSLQPEGRGEATPNQQFAPATLFQRIVDGDGIDETERAIVGAALRAYDNAPMRARTFFPVTSDQTDGTTGNVVLQLFEVPAGMEGRLTSVTVDTPQSTTITPTAPFSSASAWAFIAKAPPSSTDNDALALALRQGLVTFAPASAAGPILPGEWVFTDDQAPVARGGEMFYYVLIGGSVAALTNISVRATSRINLYAVGAQ